MKYLWMEQAACKGMTDIFFSQSLKKGQTKQDLINIAEAKRVCRNCLVIRQCREEMYNEPFGIIAGLTPQERGFTQFQKHKELQLKI